MPENYGDCSYGCGRKAYHRFKNGNACCSPHANACPAKTKRNVETRQSGKRANWKEKTNFVCPSCGITFERSRTTARTRELQGKEITCNSCSNSDAAYKKWQNYSSETKDYILNALHTGVINYCNSLSKEERIARSKTAGQNNTSYSVFQQWKSIKSQPEKLELLRKQRANTTKKIWDTYTQEERNSRIKAMLGDRKISKTCTEFLDSIESHGFLLEREVPITGFIVDGLHVETKTIISFHGDFWHCNPKFYTDIEKYCSWIGRTVGEQQLRDKRRLAAFYKLGYSVIVVWESDWKENPTSVISRVLDILRARNEHF